MKLANIRIILVNTSHPGNIGSTARAMKTMGLSQLYLVAPKMFPHPKANELASNADDILHAAVMVSDLNEALVGCSLVIGTSSRDRSLPLPALDPRQASELSAEYDEDAQIAFVFGREDSGLTNQELLRCNYHLIIPSNPDYSSLNLAAAVQVVCYELRMMANAETKPTKFYPDRLATAEEIEGFYQHLEITLKQLDFLRDTTPRRLMPRIRRLFNRVKLEEREINILRGMITAVQRKLTLK